LEIASVCESRASEARFNILGKCRDLRIFVSTGATSRMGAYLFVETKRLPRTKGITTMRLIALGLLAGLALTSAASAQTSSMGLTTGTAGMSSSAMTGGGLGDSAGSIAAGANSAVNPSGNSFLSPTPGVGAPVIGRLGR
jgi:hypothetical protein